MYSEGASAGYTAGKQSEGSEGREEKGGAGLSGGMARGGITDTRATDRTSDEGGKRTAAAAPARFAKRSDPAEYADELVEDAVGSGPGSGPGSGFVPPGSGVPLPRSFTLWGPAPPLVRRWMFRELHPSRTYVDVKECNGLETIVITFFAVIRPLYARFA